ncbi:unnamed protein product, partial [Mesorhabditis belari]|uniref:Bardet-Biedl syndrome 2 protein homolog n=1 Tax=Mesorhabditis belari TaxID=2138241 RepID=A0AAF3FFX7_9BILA
MNLQTVFSYSLDSRLEAKCVVMGTLSPQAQPTLIAVTTANKILLKNDESKLNFGEKIRTIAVAPFGNGYDVLVIGTESQVICYDAHLNTTVFQRDIPDGINNIVVGSMGGFEEVVVCGGYCAIWGFDRAGRDVFWTVTGDSVTAMCLVDYDSDGQMELVVGSADYEIRIFKNDLMRCELMETDAIVALSALGGQRFAYGLANGTLGVYDGEARVWRIKSKHIVITVLPFPTPEHITCVWDSGKIDIRAGNSGEVISKEFVNGAVSGAVLCSPSQADQPTQLTIALLDGKVRTFEVGDRRDPQEEAHQLLREYGQQKHNLLMELSNYEHEENMSKEEKEGENRIPADTQLETIPRVNRVTGKVEMVLNASNEVPIQGVVMFAEGLFPGESHVTFPKTEPVDTITVALAPQKDTALDVHIKAFMANNGSNLLHIFEVTRSLPRFSRFAILLPEENIPEQEGFVEFKLNQRMQKMVDWVYDNFIVPDDYPPLDNEAEQLDVKFSGLYPKLGTSLRIKYDVSQQQVRVEHSEMETAGAVVQSIAEHFQVTTIESHARFPKEFDELALILNEMDGVYNAKERLNAELSESQNLLKETLVRAEDALHCDHVSIARRYYTRVKHNDRAMRQAAQLRVTNQARLVTAIRRLNKLVELAARLRVGEPARQVVTQCREALSNENETILAKLFEFGA